MRDPDLVVRAQRAAAELEQAWDRYRSAHALGAEPLAPVSSYVGYSLEEPWGEPRVVFGIAAEEAERIASLLNGHACGGPPVPGQRAAATGQPAAAQPAAAQPPAMQPPAAQPAAAKAGPAAANGQLASLTAAAEIARAAAGARLQVPTQAPAVPGERLASAPRAAPPDRPAALATRSADRPQQPGPL